MEEIRTTLKEIFENMDEGNVIAIWNDYCQNCNLYDDEIIDAYTMQEMIEGSNDPMMWLNRFYFGSDDFNPEGSANPNRNYFVFNGYANIISFDYIYNSFTHEFYHIEIDDVIEYIIDNAETFGNDEIEEALTAAGLENE